MDNTDIQIVKDIHDSLETSSPDAFKISNPALEVENSLVAFLKHRLNKLEEDVGFEDDIKNAVLARLGEATFPQLITLLEILQKNSNIGVEKVLAPFIASSGEKTILDTTKEMDRTSKISEQIFEETDDKKILQSLTALTQLMDMVNTKEKSNGNDD